MVVTTRRQRRTVQSIPSLLKTLYTDLKNPAGFSSPHRLYLSAKRLRPDLKRSQVERWLESQKAYTLHRQRKDRFERRKVVTRGVRDQYQADLVDYASLKRWNAGNTFILTIIDCFSRTAFAIPLKNKRGETVKEGLKRAFKIMGAPVKLQTDKGKEFYNQHVKSLLSDKKVRHFSTESDVKASIVERFNRTLRERIIRYMTHNGHFRYLDALPDFLLGYNDRVHSGIAPYAPNQVNKQNEKTVHNLQYGDYLKRERRRHRYKIGDRVRISSFRKVFKKSYYDTNFTKEIFEIVDTLPTHPPTYRIKDLKNGELIEGSFYEEDLQRVRDESEDV